MPPAAVLQKIGAVAGFLDLYDNHRRHNKNPLEQTFDPLGPILTFVSFGIAPPCRLAWRVA
jgi:hypothetical protein